MDLSKFRLYMVIVYTGTIITAPESSAQILTHYEYLGCYRDKSGPFRVLDYLSEASGPVDLDQCVANCLNQNGGYQYMGLQNGYECWCGNNTNHTVNGLCSDTGCQCDHSCFGDGGQICGGDFALSIYNISLIVLTTPSPTIDLRTSTAYSTSEEVTSQNLTSTAGGIVDYSTTSSLSSSRVTGSTTLYSTLESLNSSSIGLDTDTDKPITNSMSPGSSKDGEENNIIVYIGGGIAAMVLIILTICLAVFFMKRRLKPATASSKFDDENEYHDLDGPEHISQVDATRRQKTSNNSTTHQTERLSELYSNGDIVKNKKAAAQAKGESQHVTLLTNDLYHTKAVPPHIEEDLYLSMDGSHHEEESTYFDMNQSYQGGAAHYEANSALSETEAVYNNI